LILLGLVISGFGYVCLDRVDEAEGYTSVKETEYDVRIYQADPPQKKLMGDIDGDGLMDIPMKYRSDGIYIKFGKNIEYGRTYNATEDYDFAILSNDTNLVYYITLISDLNGDGYDDLFVKTYSWTYDLPLLHIFYGRERYPKHIYLDNYGNSSYWDITISGYPDQESYFGKYVLVFDYDGDGKKDLFASDSKYVLNSTYKGVIYGISGDVLESKRNITWKDFSFQIAGRKYDNDVNNLGCGLYSIDFDGDGNEDWVWSDAFVTLGDNSACGLTMIIYNEGRRLSGNLTMDQFNTTIIPGKDYEDFAGMYYDRGLAKGDFNRDGIDDLLLSVGGSDGPDNTLVNCGEIAVILGSRDRVDRIDLESSRRIYFKIYGKYARDVVGAGAVDVADYNNDSYPDILFSSGVSITGFHSGAAFIWLGRENISETYTWEDAEIGFEGTSTWLGYYGSHAMFEDMNNDGFPDVILGPDSDDLRYFDIFLNKNDPPTVRFLGVEKKEVLRGEENHLWVLCYDDRTPFHDLNITIQLSVDGGEWRELEDYSYDVDERNLTVNITVPMGGELGFYSYRVKVVDSEGLSSGWVYYNDSVEVVNSPPEIERVEVVSGREYNYYENVSVLVYADDVEDGIGGLNATLHLISLSGGRRYNVSWVEVVASEHHLNITFEVLPEIENGSYDIGVRVEDVDGGVDEEVWGGRIDILDSPLRILTFNITPGRVERGATVEVHFTAKDINDEVPAEARLILWDLFTGYGNETTIFSSGEEHEKHFFGSIVVGREWPQGLYNATVRIGGREFSYSEVLTVLNSPPEVKVSEKVVEVEESGEVRVELSGMVEDYEDGAELFYEIPDPPELFEMHLMSEGGRRILVVNFEENLSGVWNVSIRVTDRDGDYVEVYVVFVVNTTSPAVEARIVPTLTVEYENTTYNETVEVSVRLVIRNEGEGSAALRVEPLSENLSFLIYQGELKAAGKIELSGNATFSLIEGKNEIPVGVRVVWDGREEILWKNITVERLKREVSHEQNTTSEKERRWIYPVGGLIVVGAAAGVLLYYLRKRRSGGSLGGEQF